MADSRHLLRRREVVRVSQPASGEGGSLPGATATVRVRITTRLGLDGGGEGRAVCRQSPYPGIYKEVA